MDHVFVYGTLMFPELLEALTQKHFKTEDATLHNYNQFKIYDGDMVRPYPAIQEERNESVEGKLIFDVDQESLDLIDFFETSDYKRQVVHPAYNNHSVHAWTYLWRDDADGKLAGRWDKDYFENNFLHLYANKIIPLTREEFYKAKPDQWQTK